MVIFYNSRMMKNFRRLIIACLGFLLCMMAYACKETDGFNDVVSKDTTKPDVVSNIRVENFNGGAHIVYDLPESENILYVLAKYRINDRTEREVKASYYTDTLTVNGFAEESEYDVTLYTVSRANIMSEPVTVKVNPMTPVYRVVMPTITLSPDFGGINIKASNELKKEIGLIFIAYDENTGLMEVQDQFFTNGETIDYSVRGYENKERAFGVYVTDQWGNISDTVRVDLTPLYEELLDKSKFSAYNLPSDTPIDFGWTLPNLWDGNTGGNGWHTRFGEQPPYVCTFNVGSSYKLSRFVMYQRLGEYTYGHGNPKDFALWGSNEAQPRDAVLPLQAEEGAIVGDWINLGNYHFPDPPSGFPPGQTNAADEAFVRAGVSFNVPFNAPEIRFIRLAVASSWSNGTAAHLMELSLYGTPQ